MCVLTRRLGRTWKYRSNRVHELKASALGREKYIQLTVPSRSSILLIYHLDQQRLKRQRIAFTLTHPYTYNPTPDIYHWSTSNPFHLNKYLDKPRQQSNPIQSNPNLTICLPQTGNSTSSTNSSPAPPDPPAQRHLNQEPRRLLAGP